MRRLAWSSFILFFLACTHAQKSSTVDLTEKEITFRNGDVTLHGVVMARRAESPGPGAVIIHGSGTSHRGNRWAAAIARGLARRGVVVLLPDKRGCGESEGDWRTADFNVLAADALAGLHALASEPNIDRHSIGIIGLSQGGHIAPLAAADQPQVRFVVNLVGGTVTLTESVTHEMRQTAIQTGLAPHEVEEVMRLHELAGDYIRTGRWEPYRHALEEGLKSGWAKIAQGFPQSSDAWQWGWWRPLIDYDPLPYWRRLAQPVLMIFGGQDEYDNVPVLRSIARLNEELPDKHNMTVVVYPSSGHALGGQDGEVRNDMLDLLAEWVRVSSSP